MIAAITVSASVVSHPSALACLARMSNVVVSTAPAESPAAPAQAMWRVSFGESPWRSKKPGQWISRSIRDECRELEPAMTYISSSRSRARDALCELHGRSGKVGKFVLRDPQTTQREACEQARGALSIETHLSCAPRPLRHAHQCRLELAQALTGTAAFCPYRPGPPLHPCWA